MHYGSTSTWHMCCHMQRLFLSCNCSLYLITSYQKQPLEENTWKGGLMVFWGKINKLSSWILFEISWIWVSRIDWGWMMYYKSIHLCDCFTKGRQWSTGLTLRCADGWHETWRSCAHSHLEIKRMGWRQLMQLRRRTLPERKWRGLGFWCMGHTLELTEAGWGTLRFLR